MCTEVFDIKDLALALFDCINIDNTTNYVGVSNEAEYHKIINELIEAQDDAPLSGLTDIYADEGLITFESGSELWFCYVDGQSIQTVKERNELDEPELAEPRESLDGFIGKFKVKT